MKKAIDVIQSQLSERKMFLYARFDCINNQQLEEFVQYVQNNVVARRMKIEYGAPTCIVLNDQENDYQFVHKNITIPVHLTQLEQNFPVKDFTIPFYLHILPKTNQIVLIFNHMIADARFIFNLITGFTQKQPFQQELFDSPCVLLKNQIQKHQAITKYIESNNFKVPELPNQLNCHICRITTKIEDVPFMTQSHTQRISIISVLLKLRLLQKESLMTPDDIMSSMSASGISTFTKLVADMRPYVKQFKANCGNFISFHWNSCKLQSNETVAKTAQKLRQQLRDLKEQKQYLEGLKDIDTYKDSGMLKGLVTSSFGSLKTPFKKVNIKQHSFDDQNPGFLFLYSYTIDDYMTVILQYNDQQAPYAAELRSWLNTLIQNFKDDITIDQLYKLLQ